MIRPSWFYKRMSVAAAALICTMAVVGCAGLGKRLEPPRINLANIRVEEMTGLETAFLIQLRVFNTNERELQVSAIECDLDLNGLPFATGVSKAAVTIPSFGSEIVSITMYSSVLSMFRSMLNLQHQRQLSYRLTGKLRLTDPEALLSSLPFTSEGSLSLQDLTPRPNP